MWVFKFTRTSHGTTVGDIQKNIVDAYNNLASQSMISAANEIEGTRD